MSSRKKPINAFISYSHKDRKHLERLQTNLAALEHEGRVKFWWDGAVEVGKPWNAQIMQALERADVVVLLLTANFLASEYCVENELKLAQQREKKGLIDLIPILVEPFDYEFHWLAQVQAITINGKPVTASRPAAWEKVARQLRLKIECLEGKRPVMHVLNEVEEVVHSGQVPLAELSTSSPKQDTFFSVSDFWHAKSTLLPYIDLVTVQGTLSQFAPMVMGPPRAKRLLHREFRKAIENNRHFGQRKRITINACMSISSGQMVHLEAGQNKPKRLLGLYESIARNCIPVFVTTEYYETEVLPKFKESRGQGCFEASVTGRIFLLDNSFIRRFLTRQGIDKILPSYLIDELSREAYALEVGGARTGVQSVGGRPRYIDGDIWLALQSGGRERFLTGFVDITNAEERDEEMQRLHEEAQESTILACYDKLGSIEQLLDTESKRKSKLRG